MPNSTISPQCMSRLMALLYLRNGLFPNDRFHAGVSWCRPGENFGVSHDLDHYFVCSAAFFAADFSVSAITAR
jgi:hypothetical protein